MKIPRLQEWGFTRKQQDMRCLKWPGRLAPTGYGQFTVGRNSRYYTILAHRAMYEGVFGRIPKGFHIDHICRNRACINPLHMQVVTPGENVLRGIGPSAKNARKTHCPKGHALIQENISKRTDGRRSCNVCARLRWREKHSVRAK